MLVRELVVRVEVLRDPHKDVEEERVRRELQPIVHPRPFGQAAVRRVVRRVGHEEPGREGQDQRRDHRTLEPIQPRRRRQRAKHPNPKPLPGRRLRRVGVRAEAPPYQRAELFAEGRVDLDVLGLVAEREAVRRRVAGRGHLRQLPERA